MNSYYCTLKLKDKFSGEGSWVSNFFSCAPCSPQKKKSLIKIVASDESYDKVSSPRSSLNLPKPTSALIPAKASQTSQIESPIASVSQPSLDSEILTQEMVEAEITYLDLYTLIRRENLTSANKETQSEILMNTFFKDNKSNPDAKKFITSFLIWFRRNWLNSPKKNNTHFLTKKNENKMKNTKYNINYSSSYNEGIEIQNSQTPLSDTDKRNFDKVLELRADYNRDIDEALDLRVCNTCKCFKKMRARHGVQIETCSNCLNQKNKLYTSINDAQPTEIPKCLLRLSKQEKRLIALLNPTTPIITLTKSAQGNKMFRGNVAIFMNDLQFKIDKLPNLSGKYILVREKGIGRNLNTKMTIVRRQYVLEALLWLKENNFLYKDIEISEEDINKLPENSCFAECFDHEDDNNVTPRNENEKEQQIISYQDMTKEFIMPECQETKSKEQIENEFKIKFNFDSELVTTAQRKPLNLKDIEHVLQKAHPCIFPRGEMSIDSIQREFNIPKSHMMKHIISHSDRRFTSCDEFVYLIHSIARQVQILDSSLYHWKHNQDLENITAEELREDPIKLKIFVKGIYAMTKTIIGSKAFYINAFKELSNMVWQLHMPLFFITITAADFHWPEIDEVLRRIDHSNDTEMAKYKLLKKYPALLVTLDRIRMNYICKELIPKLESIEDYWLTYEYQKSGALHVHGLFFTGPNEPLIQALKEGKNTKDAMFKSMLIEKIEEHLSERVPYQYQKIKDELNDSIHPSSIKSIDVPEEDLIKDYVHLLSRLGEHEHRVHYCYTPEEGPEKCRFGFPRPIRKESVIEETKDRRTSTKTEERYMGKRNHSTIISHMIPLLLICRSSIEVTPCLTAERLVYYLTKYSTKDSNISPVRTTIYDILKDPTTRSDDSSKRIAMKYMYRSAATKMISKPELCQQISLKSPFECSRIFVQCNPSVLKVDKSKNDENGDVEPDVKLTNLVDQYLKRNKCHAEYNLFQWFQEFRWENKKLVRNTKKPIILNSTNGGKDDPNSPKYEEYVKQYSLRFRPWPLDSEHIPRWTFEENKSFKEEHVRQTGKDLMVPVLLKMSASGISAADEKDSDSVSNFESDFEDAKIFNKDEQCDPLDIYDNDNLNNDEESRRINVLEVNQTEIEKAKDFFKSLSKHNSKGKYEYDMSLKVDDLTEDQRIVLESIFRLDSGNIIVTGGAGTGKSRIILTAMTQSARKNMGESYIKLLAYTGVAARNIGGETFNGALSFQKHGKIYTELSEEKLSKLRESFKGVKIVIIDEFSMMSSQQLFMIHRRLQSVRDNNKDDFGGLKIVLIGDPAQLPPVGAPVVWNTTISDHTKLSKLKKSSSMIGNDSDTNSVLNPEEVQKDPSSYAGNVLYNKFDLIFALKDSMRAVNDKQLTGILNNMREYKLTSKQIDTLYMNNSSNYEKEFSIFKAVHLCASNQKCKDYNEKAAIETIDTKFSVDSIDSLGKQQRNDPYYSAVGGVRVNVVVYGTMRFMLTNNLNTRLGLVNGAMGIIRKVCVSKNKQGSDKFEYVIAEFDNRLDLTAEMRIKSREIFSGLECNPGRFLIPIFKISGFSADIGSRRFGLPIIPANAITVHKSQGLTLDKIAIDLSGVNKQQNGLLYVALSRVRSLNDMIIKKVPRKQFEKFKSKNKLSPAIMDCLNEIKRIKQQSAIKSQSDNEISNEAKDSTSDSILKLIEGIK